MIIPVRCFTCGRVLGDKWLYWLREVEKNGNDNDNDNAALLRHFDARFHGDLLDTLGLTRICCRRHMLTHVDIVDILA
jgi:DNA-directed RNA polymerase subunit N (RpoN/RPB10)